MSDRRTVGVVGARGHTGAELVRLIAGHPSLDLVFAGSRELAGDPVRQFARWYTEASQSGVVEPNAMVLSTADQRGRPSSRTVLLKGFDERGFVFFTNYTSRKGAELAANPYASLLFGGAGAIGPALQSVGITTGYYLFNAAPYVLTLVILILSSSATKAFEILSWMYRGLIPVIPSFTASRFSSMTLSSVKPGIVLPL